MRSFIGVDFSRELKKSIAGLQAELKAQAAAGRWKYFDNFHLTLKFLDEIDQNTVLKINEGLSDICSRIPPFKLKISGLGSFPGKDSLRVLWLGLGGDTERLRSLQDGIEACTRALGFKEEKRGYTPHVTIGQDIVFNKAFDRIRQANSTAGYPELTVDRVYLFKSEQIGSKRVYTPVSEFKLQVGN